MQDERINIKYAFTPSLGDEMPRSFISRVLGWLGYVSAETARRREELIVDAANRHIFETVIRDRKAYLEALKAERGALAREAGQRH